MKVYIKNMVSENCMTIVKEKFTIAGLHEINVELGVVEILQNISATQFQQLRYTLSNAGYDFIDNKKKLLVDKIKVVIEELICHSDTRLDINFSDYISDKLQYDYTYLANVFSKEEGISIEKHLITQKITRVKELIANSHMNLTEIARK